MNFGFGSTAISCVFNIATFGASFALFFYLWDYFFWFFWATFEFGVRFKNNFGNYLCRQSTLVLDMQPYLFVFNSPKFGAFLALFEPFGAIFGVQFKFKNFFGTFSIT